MAGVTSLGVHTPSALPYLIGEGILPSHPTSDSYTWETYDNNTNESEEELVTTENTVVYSKDGYVQELFRFEKQDQRVRLALLTTFDNFRHEDGTGIKDTTALHGPGPQSATTENTRRKPRTSGFGSKLPAEPRLNRSIYQKKESSRHKNESRAIVILLDREAQIHFLTGGTYLVKLPFDIERAFPTPDGLLVERRDIQWTRRLDSFAAPIAPPGSFLSAHLNASYSKSPPTRSRVSISVPNTGPFDLENINGELHNAYYVPMKEENEEFPLLYSLTDPLGDFCALAQSTIAPLARQLRPTGPDLLVEYDNLDRSERIIYVSSRDELEQKECSDASVPLLLLVTVNRDLGQITIWQGWYLRSRSLSAIMTARALLKASRARRRNSYASTVGAGTGAVTPMARHRDRTRESFAAAARLPGEAPPSKQKPSHQAVKRSKDDDEEAMASRMDPDFQTSQGPAQGPRRVSSLLARGDLSTADPARGHVGPNASFGGPGRRGTSFGASQDRRSLGTSIYRRSRGSTPGSIFSRSLGPEDDTMEIDDFASGEQDEIAQVQQLFLATQTSTGLDTALGCASDGVKQDFVVRKVHVIPVDMKQFSEDQLDKIHHVFKVETLLLANRQQSERQSLSLLILNHATNCLTTHEISVAQPINIIPDDPVSRSASAKVMSIPVPLYRTKSDTLDVHDLAKVRKQSATTIVSSRADKTLQILSTSGASWTVALPMKARVFDPTDTRTVLDRSKRDIGRRRLTDIEHEEIRISRVGSEATVCIKGSDATQHRFQLDLRPRNMRVSRALEVMEFVLGHDKSHIVSQLWMSAKMYLSTAGVSSADRDQFEWDALIMTFMSLAAGSLGVQPHAQPSGHRGPRRRAHHRPRQSEQQLSNVSRSSDGPAWNWLKAEKGASRRSMSGDRAGRTTTKSASTRTLSMLDWEGRTRHFIHTIAVGDLQWLSASEAAGNRRLYATKALAALHLLREEWKLSVISNASSERDSGLLAACLAQVGHWLQLDSWGWETGSYYELEGATAGLDYSESVMVGPIDHYQVQNSSPPSILAWIEAVIGDSNPEPFLGLDQVAALEGSFSDPLLSSAKAETLLPGTAALRKLFVRLPVLRLNSQSVVEEMQRLGLTGSILDLLPEAAAASLREAIAECQSRPSPTWALDLLRIVGREDLVTSSVSGTQSRGTTGRTTTLHGGDIQAVCSLAERSPMLAKTHEADRHSIIQQLFSEDRRYMEASRLTNPSALQIAECPPQPEWSEVEHLDQQKRVMQWVMTRTMALSPGNAMVHFESQRPLLSEKFHVSGFSMLCQMKPMDNTISADRTGFTEEKLSWAFFHAGTSAGLHVSRHAAGIDTSWIMFNKPNELTNRHAGFLFALGLNGHLRTLAKWLAFKYLTPKHTMTSVGLLLGISASYLGTMDSLITRMLSVHISRMLPAGASELNVSPLTQTAGLMGIGLLYYNTQHRRMSEIMLSEIEHRADEDSEAFSDSLRDESYRLAAGFALGLINLGKGADLQGLHGMGLLERLLSVAVGSRPVEMVHVVDKAIAGAVMAVALVYMKTGDKAVARKIDVPDTIAQLDHVRPDILLLRSLAKNMIMWDEISDEPGWIRRSLPRECMARYLNRRGAEDSAALKLHLKSDDIPMFNIIAGLAWSISLKFAGSGNTKARDEILIYLSLFTNVSKQEAYYYDAMLARNTAKRCIDLLALAAATIMAGTGDIVTFRHLRRLHGRTDASTTYGSHVAAHLAIGTLFLGGGTYTFGTSNLAVASLICAFYPLFPSDVLDNNVHLQALRHLWVFAAEPRCIIAMDIDTRRPVPLDIKVVLKSGKEMQLKAPCLLPELDTLITIQTEDPTYWPVTLDFVANPEHLATFRESQTLYIRKAPAHVASPLLFSSTLTSLNEAQSMPPWRQAWEWFLKLPAFRDIDEASLSLVLPPIAHSSIHLDEKGTVLDDRLALAKSVGTFDRNELWNLRILFKWAEEAKSNGSDRVKWLGDDTINKLRAEVERRIIEMAAPIE